MKFAIPVVAAVMLTCGAASAQTSAPKTTVICLEVSGSRQPAVCNVPSSLLDKSEYLCRCVGTGMPTDVAVCPAGVKAPAESLDLDRARSAAVKEKRFSLVGATYKGQAMCVDARDPLNGR